MIFCWEIEMEVRHAARAVVKIWGPLEISCWFFLIIFFNKSFQIVYKEPSNSPLSKSPLIGKRHPWGNAELIEIETETSNELLNRVSSPYYGPARSSIVVVVVVVVIVLLLVFVESVCARVYVHVCACIRACVRVHTFVCARSFMRVRVHTCVSAAL